jgi:hypothetical protein
MTFFITWVIIYGVKKIDEKSGLGLLLFILFATFSIVSQIKFEKLLKI